MLTLKVSYIFYYSIVPANGNLKDDILIQSYKKGQNLGINKKQRND